MPDPRQPAYESLDPDAKALVDRWAAELQDEPQATLVVFRFLLAMVAVKHGALREVGRKVIDGTPSVVLVDPIAETFYGVQDPQLGANEADVVAAMAAILEGSS